MKKNNIFNRVFVLLSFVLFILAVSGYKLTNNSLKVMWSYKNKVAATETPSHENLYLDSTELKEEIINSDSEEYKQDDKNDYFYIESKMEHISEKTEYEMASYDSTLVSTYEINDNEVRFVWEYYKNDAQEYLDNTIKQLSLCELYPDSELYTYSNGYDIDEGMIDVYWADKDYSYVANMPIDLLHSDIDFVINFCKTKKVEFSEKNLE